jgi:hypothetical protein
MSAFAIGGDQRLRMRCGPMVGTDPAQPARYTVTSLSRECVL